MPELAEVKLTAEYVTQVSDGLVFEKIEKNPVHKGKEVSQPYEKFRLRAESRGKEMVLYLRDMLTSHQTPMRMTMGMSGHFELTRTGEEPKHAHLKFYSTSGQTLSFVDVRRFGKWFLGQAWSSDRGPDPIQQYEDFVHNIKVNLHRPAFSKPICEVMMNQKYFNGIGNYLRAEILYRTDTDPWLEARVAIEQQPEILEWCKVLPQEAYRLGGGQLKDWQNPFGESNSSWNEFMKCYGNETMSKLVDRNGRTIWYHPKWDPITIDMESEWDHYSGLPNPKAYEKYRI